MVKVGFIVEGDTEKIVVESIAFQDWAKNQGIEICSPVINAKGGGNLLPQNILPIVSQLKLSSPDHIVILTDLENEPNIEVVKKRIGSDHTNLIFVAVKAIESWFLADSQALQKWLELPEIQESQPENMVGMPWDRLKELAKVQGKRGPGSNKAGFAKKMCKHYGFTIANAAKHSACPSVKYFHDEFIKLANV
jgi:hypothetical protein